MNERRIFSQAVTVFTAVLLFSIPPLLHAQSSNDNCDYSSADLHNGWGWDPVLQQSCSPLNTAEEAVDTCDYSAAAFNDNWGWDPINARSCPPRVADNDQNACIDSDGDGWGWNGTETCLPSTNDLTATTDNPCIDTDGDGWGWNGTSSCRIDTVTQSTLQCSVYNTIELTSGAQYALVNERESPENLAVVNLQTGAIRPVAELNNTPSTIINNTSYTAPVNSLVSDNGQRVLFLSDEERTVPSRSGSEIFTTRLLFVADVQAGTIKTASVDEQGMHIVATTDTHEISTDARTAVFESNASNQEGIYIRHLDTEQTSRVTRTIDANYRDAVYRLVDMSANGKYVLFYANLRELGDVRDNKYFMYDVSADTVTEVTALTHRFYTEAVVSNDGTTITYAWQAGVFVVNIIDGSETEVFDQFGIFSSMSPDGRYISNISSIDNVTNNRTLLVFDRQTGNIRELTFTRSNYRFTDDSNGLVFTRENISSLTDNESLFCGRTYLTLSE